MLLLVDVDRSRDRLTRMCVPGRDGCDFKRDGEVLAVLDTNAVGGGRTPTRQLSSGEDANVVGGLCQVSVLRIVDEELVHRPLVATVYREALGVADLQVDDLWHDLHGRRIDYVSTASRHHEHSHH